MELDASGEKPLYKPREWTTGLRKGDLATVIFVPATPGSQLKRGHMREIKVTEFKIKVVEQSGTTLLKSHATKIRPLQTEAMRYNADRLLCRTDGKGSCRSTGVTYELVCQACKSKYVGETSRIRSASTRGRETLHALERREESSVM